MAQSIAEWQQGLDLEGSVSFRQSRLRMLILFIGSLLFLSISILALISDGAALWSILGIPLFGLGSFHGGRLLVVGSPSLTVSRTGLTRRGLREVAFSEIRELMTSNYVFGFHWQPQPGEELRGRSQRKTGLRFASIPAKAAVDQDLLAQWILHLKDPSKEIVTEAIYHGTGVRWRLADSAV